MKTKISIALSLLLAFPMLAAASRAPLVKPVPTSVKPMEKAYGNIQLNVPNCVGCKNLELGRKETKAVNEAANQENGKLVSSAMNALPSVEAATTNAGWPTSKTNKHKNALAAAAAYAVNWPKAVQERFMAYMKKTANGEVDAKKAQEVIQRCRIGGGKPALAAM